jgi:hypothetical protein
MVFAAVLDQYDVRRRVDAAGTVAGLGAGYGVFLWLVAAGVVMSLWLNAVGVATPLPTSLSPDFSVTSSGELSSVAGTSSFLRKSTERVEWIHPLCGNCDRDAHATQG